MKLETLLPLIIFGPVGIVVLYVLLKLFFKKSLLFRLCFATGIAMLITALLANLAATMEVIHYGWIIPVTALINIGAYAYISSMVKKPLQAIITNLQELSKGNLTLAPDKDILDRSDELGLLARATKETTDKLNEVVESVKKGAEHIASAGAELNSSSQQLSQSTNDQASSVEEVSASMEEMTANVEQNSSNAAQTEIIAANAAKLIKENKESVEVAVSSMKSIAQKITIINDIAFQTNILALNAAVEASRAGEHGRGFAVVAAEVRKLAEHSKVAAEEIDRLSKSGVDIAEKAGEQLEGIVKKIQKTANLIHEISSASQEQRSGSDQINQAIQQFNHLTQANASATQEVASNAQELASQAETLLEKISFFETSAKKTSSVKKEIAKKTEASNAPTPQSSKDKGQSSVISTMQKQKTSHKDGHAHGSKKGFDLKLSDKTHTDDQYESF